MTTKADGQEILVVDSDEKVQRGMSQLLRSLGLVPTVLGDTNRARVLIKEKYFEVALVDLDSPRPSAGLELVRTIREEAPMTTVFVLASRRAFEAAVDVLRAGAADLIVKAPDQVEYLKQRVVEACERVRHQAADDRLLAEVLSVHEDFLRRLMDTARHAAELEEQLGGGAQAEEADGPCTVLLVEEDGWLASQLRPVLEAHGGYALHTAASGGEGLDVVTRSRFQIALVRQTLPDLPGSMVVSALKTQSPDTIAILFSRPGPQPGKADIIEGSRPIPLIPSFTEAQPLLERIDELREAFRRTSRERRYLAAFRQQNYELLRRYADLKQKLTRAK